MKLVTPTENPGDVPTMELIVKADTTSPESAQLRGCQCDYKSAQSRWFKEFIDEDR